MNKIIKKQWLDDLINGSYTQGFSQLTDGVNFCCLGVLCEQALKAGVVTTEIIKGRTFYISVDFSLLKNACFI